MPDGNTEPNGNASKSAPPVDKDSLEIDRVRARLATFERFNTVGELARGIVHEINQPLAAIANYASALRSEIVAEPDRSGADYLQTLSEIEEQAIRAASIVRNLRRLSRRAESYHRICDIADLISEIAPLMQSQAVGCDVLLRLDLPSDLSLISVDYHQVQHALMCMFSHAVAAICERQPRERQVVVRTNPSGVNEIEIAVLYSCCDRSAEELKGLFQPFKLNDLTNSNFHLAVCRRIADIHHGNISAEHLDDDRTLLRFCLPIGPKGHRS
ncbi:MAG: histidine kinase dimerization/phospho-acceptor domain-containing protein [Pirellulaceae bacterium]